MPGREKWDDLRYILAVADAGSVNAAAVKTGVNHATILRRIASFEASHGLSVFVKSSSGYRVSPECIQVIEAIRKVDTSVDALRRIIVGKGPSLNGVINLTSTDSLCRAVLPKIIRDFHNVQRDLTISLYSTNSRLNLAKLDADVTVRPAKTLPAELTGTRVGSMYFQAYATVNYLKRHTSSDPKEHRWLGGTELLARSPVGEWLEDLPPEVFVFKADSFATIADVAETGMGIAMLPTFLGFYSQFLVPVPMFGERLETGVWVASHPDMATSENIATCIAFLNERLGQALAFAEDPH